MLLAPYNDTDEVRIAVRETLANSEERTKAALILATLRDGASVDSIMGRLRRIISGRDSFAIGQLAVALGMLGDARVAPELQVLLATAPGHAVLWLTQAIHRLTGHGLPLPEVDDVQFIEQVRRDWLAVDLSTPPSPRVERRLVSPRICEAVVTNGRGLFALAADDPEPGFEWPEWDYSWRHGSDRLYDTGGSCTTCDLILDRVGWASEDAVRLAQVVRQQVANVDQLDEPTMAALEPLLCALAPGRYQVRLENLHLEATTWAKTWFAAESSALSDPGGTMYQPPRAQTSSRVVIAATQPDSALDESTVTQFAACITAGDHPVAVVAAFAAVRQPHDSTIEHPCVTGFIIDGHHKMAAYTSLGLPCRMILICDRTPRQPAYTADPLAVFDEMLAQVQSADGRTVFTS